MAGNRALERELGLCARCRWRRAQPTRRGSVFHRCTLADHDDRFLRYPPVPVTVCPGHEPGMPTAPERTQRGRDDGDGTP